MFWQPASANAKLASGTAKDGNLMTAPPCARDRHIDRSKGLYRQEMQGTKTDPRLTRRGIECSQPRSTISWTGDALTHLAPLFPAIRKLTLS
jgi:hypothetical protein